MMTSEVIMEMAEKMDKSLDAFKQELTKIRTGRASLSLLDGIKVEAYNSSMPLNQVGTLTIPESRQIVIQPWDPQVMSKVIRINIPQLTEERRKELVKIVKKIAEEYRVAVRNHRRDAIDILKKQKKNKEISEDEQFKLQDEAQKETDSYIAKIDEVAAEKENEVMEV
jgi:ribosome recycling factor